MANIRTDVIYTIVDGAEVVFKAPCDCSEVAGLTVYYPDSEGVETSTTFAFKDAHGNDLADIENTFKEGAYVKVILNTTELAAYIQNADTNKYLEDKFNTKAPTDHTHNANAITAGTFAGTVVAPASTNYTNAEIRNAVIADTDPGEGVELDYPNGTLVFSKV